MKTLLLLLVCLLPLSFVPQTVPPGGTVTNSDGVTVEHRAGSTGTVTIDPVPGDASSATTVDINQAHAKVTGVDANDTVNINGPGGPHTVEGTGGIVNLNIGCVVTIRNTAPAGSGQVVTVKLPDGSWTIVRPGAEVIVSAPPE